VHVCTRAVSIRSGLVAADGTHERAFLRKADPQLSLRVPLAPLGARQERSAYPDLEEVYASERHLLYVACTRAREQLLMTSVAPGSEFLADLGTAAVAA
jgi:ATP-dependent exoDNAse (exonuclease V) beta subunit